MASGRSTSTARVLRLHVHAITAPACAYAGFAKINLEWTGPVSLRVTMRDPSLEWTFVATETTTLRVLNVISPRMPLWTWRSQLIVRTRELLANHVLGMGEIRMSGTMPSGHTGILMPQRMYFIDDATRSWPVRTLDIRQRSVPIRESATFSYLPAASDRPSRLGHPRLRRVHTSAAPKPKPIADFSGVIRAANDANSLGATGPTPERKSAVCRTGAPDRASGRSFRGRRLRAYEATAYIRLHGVVGFGAVGHRGVDRDAWSSDGRWRARSL